MTLIEKNLLDLTLDFTNSNFKSSNNLTFTTDLQIENNFPLIYDNNFYIHTILNINNNLLEKIKAESSCAKIKILNSNFDLISYKINNKNEIGLMLILIINDLIILETNEIKLNLESLYNINNHLEIVNKIQNFIFNFIKNNYKFYNNQIPFFLINKETFLTKKIKNHNSIIENILIGNKSFFNKIKLWNIENYNNNFNINSLFNFINFNQNLNSYLQINPLLINLNFENYDKNNLFLNTIIIQDKNYLNNLKEKYIKEMPNEIQFLINKYKNIKFNKKMFDDYKEKINNINNENDEINNNFYLNKDEDELNNNNSSQKKFIFQTYK
jgi:hypothetical protein